MAAMGGPVAQDTGEQRHCTHIRVPATFAEAFTSIALLAAATGGAGDAAAGPTAAGHAANAAAAAAAAAATGLT